MCLCPIPWIPPEPDSALKNIKPFPVALPENARHPKEKRSLDAFSEFSESVGADQRYCDTLVEARARVKKAEKEGTDGKHKSRPFKHDISTVAIGIPNETAALFGTLSRDLCPRITKRDGSVKDRLARFVVAHIRDKIT